MTTTQTNAIANYRKAAAAYRKATKHARFSDDRKAHAAEELAYDLMIAAEALAYPA